MTTPGITLAAAKLATIADFLRTLPMDLPEPGMHTYSGGTPGIRFSVDADTALNIVSVVGGHWSVHTYDPPRTIADRYLHGTYDEADLCVTVVVEGVNLPDLAVTAVAS